MKNKIIPYNPKLKEYARKLRKNSTLAEVLLWNNIKNRALGVQFHRQVPMLNYIVDFYCHELMLAIEIDGSSHDYRYFEDLNRQNKLEEYGVTFMRFSDVDVKNNMFSVSLSLEENVASLITPIKSPQGDNQPQSLPKSLKQTLMQTHQQIKPYIHKTPVLSSQLINEIAGCNVFFKCENFQKMGDFKMRGATNAILSLSPEQRNKGVVTHSSGNFAQALSLAAKKMGIPAYIVMPKNAPQVKKNAVKTYEGEIIECDSNPIARENMAELVRKEKGATFIHPSNDDAVILGNATAAMELLEDSPDLDYVFSPVGGGGLLAGTALAANNFSQHCKVIGGEPKNADDAYRSLQSGKIEFHRDADTIADGLRTFLGDRNFPIIKKYVERIITVSEEEIIEAMKLIWERMKIVVEPSSAVAFAALLKEKEQFKNKEVGIIISGGNVDVSNLPF